MTLPVRLRLTIACAVTAALVSALGVVIFANLVGEAVQGGADIALADGAAPFVAALRQGPPAPGSVGPAEPFVQVFAPGGAAVESSPTLFGDDLLGPAQRRSVTTSERWFTVRLREDTRVLAIPVGRPDGTWLVVVGRSLVPADAVVADVTRDLLLGAAAITALGSLGAWLLAGAALRPVERMRREAALISERDPASPLSVPPTHDELTALATTLNELLRRVREGRGRERRLVSDAAHELRTPLAILRTELELAGRPGRSREELAEAVASSTGEVNRLVSLADDLLLLARTDEGITLDRKREEPVEPILRAASRASGAAAALRDVRIQVDAAAWLVADIDPGRVRQAVDNLVSNALRYAPPGSAVRVAAWDDGGCLAIEVSDRGPGFPPEFLPRAFERFSRADAGRGRERGGTGLGLAVVRAIALAHEGEVAARNQEAGGALVRISIPPRR